MATKKEIEVKKEIEGQPTKIDAVFDLWSKRIKPIPIKKYSQDAEDTEKMIVFSETFAGKTRFYLSILQYLQKIGLKKEDLLMTIIYPDRPKGLASLYGMIPKEYQEGVVNVFPVNNYEDTIIATATSVEMLNDHYKRTGVHGWLVAELMESYWLYSQDFFCRFAYGQSIMEYMAKMQSVLNEKKSDKGSTAYEAFAGPFGGPWPIIKMAHNLNWIDKLKKMPFNIVFTSEIKEEDNKDSIFEKWRPAGEKHMQHKFDTILYLTHKGDNYFMKPFKISGYEKLYGEINITGKNGYDVHREALKRLESLGYKTTKMEDLERQAGIVLPKQKVEEKTITMISKNDESKISKNELTEQPKKEAPKDEWNI